jgi:ABC-type transporter Mla subunit MlaD
LASESDELQQAVAAVASAVGSVESFVRDNRGALSKNIRKLTSVMSAIASEKDNLRSALEIAPTAMDSLHLGFDHSTGSQNSRVGIAGNIWTADGFLCGLLQQAPGVPRALKDVACDLIAQLLSPIIDNLPPLPPGYEQYVPKPALNKNGQLNLPIAPDMGYLPNDDPSLTGLLGGGS